MPHVFGAAVGGVPIGISRSLASEN